MSNSEKPKDSEMSETHVAQERANKDAADKHRRVQTWAKVSAWMTNEPEGFDRIMAKLAEDPEVVKEFAAAGLFPVTLTPEERELADRMLAEMREQELAKGKQPAPK